MERPAHEAEEYLWNLAHISYSKCALCGTGAQGLETHVVGQAHWKKLGGNFNWRLPPPDIADDLSRPWVERIPTPKGPYFFNHVTGRHGFLDEAGGTSPPQDNSSPVTSPTYEPASAPVPYPQAAAISAAPDLDRAYQDGLMSKDKGGWRRFMEPLATAAGEELERVSGNWDYACPICDQPNTRGLADHVPSEKHWKKLGEKLSWKLPHAEAAHAMDKPWVQRIPTVRGDFFFNHLTGAYGLEGQSAVLGVTASSPAIAPTTCYTCSTPVAVPSACPTSSNFNHAHWLWVKTVSVAAKQVDELISHPRFEGGSPPCSVCSSVPLSKAHLLSFGHFSALQNKCALIPEDVTREAMEGYSAKLEEESAPWVQNLKLDGKPYYLNHVTGKELWPQAPWE